MDVTPAARPVAKPAALMLAVEVADEFQVTEAVRFLVVRLYMFPWPRTAAWYRRLSKRLQEQCNGSETAWVPVPLKGTISGLLLAL